MRDRVVVAIAILLNAGCFAPSAIEGVACGPGGLCPDGLTCDVNQVCRGELLPSVGDDVPQTPVTPPATVDENPVSLGSEVFFEDFDGNLRLADGVTVLVTGPAVVTPVEGYRDYGFAGNFARNASRRTWGTDKYQTQTTTFVITGLPAHETVTLGGLLAIIDSWDGLSADDPDRLEIKVDGELVFSHVMCNYVVGRAFQDYDPPQEVVLVHGEELGFSTGDAGTFVDGGYDLGKDPMFQAIPHTASSLTLSIRAGGSVWDGGGDESFALDNLQVTVN